MKIRHLIISLAIAVSSAPVTVAQDMEHVLVTASRIPLDPSLSGSSFTVLDSNELVHRQQAYLADVLRSVPGVVPSQSGPAGSLTQLRVRGGEANHVLVFLDGIEINDLTQGSEFNFAQIQTGDIEKIEVIRGPQSALWGSDAMSAVVNITSAKGAGPAAVNAFLEGGSFDTVRGGGSFSAAADGWHFSLSGSMLDTDGINISRNGDEKDGSSSEHISFTGGYSPVETLQLGIAARHSRQEIDFDGLDFVTGLPADADNHTEAAQDYARVTARVSLLNDSWQHRLGASFAGTENDNFLDRREDSSTQGRKYRIDYQTSMQIHSPVLPGLLHDIVLAAEYEKEEFTQRGLVTFFGNPNQDRDVDTTSVIGEYRLTWNNVFSVSAGIRHDNHSDFRDVTTWRFSTAANFTDTGTRLHGSYGIGSKNPTFTERFGFFSTSSFPFIGNPALRPEENRGWDLGIEQSVFNDRARLGVTYFAEELRDEINGFAFDPVALATTAVNEDGNSDRSGVELYGQARLGENLVVSVNYTWLDASEPDPGGVDVREVRRPEHTANLNINYSFLQDRGNINFDTSINSSQLDVFFPPPFFTETRISLDSYTLVTVAASWKLTDEVSLFGRVENLLDERYEEVLGFRQEGVAFHAGLKFGFTPFD